MFISTGVLKRSPLNAGRVFIYYVSVLADSVIYSGPQSGVEVADFDANEEFSAARASLARFQYTLI